MCKLRVKAQKTPSTKLITGACGRENRGRSTTLLAELGADLYMRAGPIVGGATPPNGSRRGGERSPWQRLADSVRAAFDHLDVRVVQEPIHGGAGEECQSASKIDPFDLVGRVLRFAPSEAVKQPVTAATNIEHVDVVQEALPTPRGPLQERIVTLANQRTAHQRITPTALDRGLEGEIEVGQSLAGGHPRGRNRGPDASLLTRGQFDLEHRVR